MKNYGIPEVDNAISDFSNRADYIKSQANELLKTIAEGRVPSKDAVGDFDTQIEGLRSCYDNLVDLARTKIPAEDCPADGEPIYCFASTLAEYESQLTGAKEILQKFASVRSCVDSYTKAIEPYQNDAHSLLESLSSGETIDSTKLAGPTLFLKTIESPDLTTDEGLALLEEVSDFYSGKVLFGLQNKKYFIAAEPQIDDNPTKTELPTEAVEDDSLRKTSNAIDETVNVPAESINGEVTTVESMHSSDSVASTELSMESVEEETDTEAESIDTPKDDVLLAPSKKIKTNTPSAAGFKQEIADLRRFAKDILSILPLLTNLGALTERQIFRFGVCMSCYTDNDQGKQKVSFALNQLVNKSMLALYVLSNGESVYCLTPYSHTCLQKESIRTLKIWDVSFGNYPICGKNEMSESVLSIAIDENETLLTYFDGIKASLPNKEYNKIKSSIKHIEGGYLVGVWASEFVICSTVVDSDDEYPKLYINDTPGEDVSVGYRYLNGKVIDLSAKDNEFAQAEIETTECPTAETDSGNDMPADENALLGNQTDTVAVNETVPVKIDSDDIETVSVLSVDTPINAPELQVAVEPISDIKDYVYQLIIDNKIFCASAYAKAASLENATAKGFYSKLAYAVNDPMYHCEYSSDSIFSLMNETQTDFDYALIVAASARTFFSNQVRYDFGLKSLYAGIKDYPILQECPSLSKALYTISEYKIKQCKGMDAYADYRLKDAGKIEQNYRQLQKEARNFYDGVIIQKREDEYLPVIETKKLLFSPNGDIGQYISAIVNGQDDMIPLAEDFLINSVNNSRGPVSESTISQSLVADYIRPFEDKAINNLPKKYPPITGSRKTNIIKLTLRAIQLISRWCDLVERKSSSAQDDGAVAYKIAKKGLCENLENAFVELDNLINKESTKELLAGITIVKQTAAEIKACISGEYDENSHRFFYAPFLLSNEVCLTDEYLPDMDMHGATIPELKLQSRIRRFASIDYLPLYIERIHQLVSDPDDNCGTAKLLLDYYSLIAPTKDLTASIEIISNSEDYAQKDARRKKDNFIGELEFAQANGQIDNSTEDTKEIILQVINNWYDWAQDTGNYGFFGSVLDAYLDQIRKSAKEREGVLLGQLEEISKSAVDMFSPEEKAQKIDKIKSMITEQKYTAAEDLLTRFWTKEENDGSFFDKDFLNDFLFNYEDYYRPVSSHQSSFSVLASKRGYSYNKEAKQASDLAENWLPGGSDLGSAKLKIFLNLLGFKVRKIDTPPRISIGKTTYENYFVYTEPIRKYSHPIAAFGTGAATDGFRIVCMTGIYNADQLISVMQQIGNAKHTLVLLDDALPIVERRRLARKTKNELGDKFIGVLDRVVMMYLVRNFDQTHNNRMLLSLVAPFGYYQPYVWKSADPMPPELFIGRKKELEAIESRSGVNIVYGGRQLGKSALLKKAKDDIDKDENGDRAVYIDIKYKTYDKVAQTIGHALFDCGVLNEDIDTTDWDELSRCIKRRLQSSQNPIPYLLLLLDEADTFIESSEAIKYAPFDSLKDIQGTGKFKFVVAGLHNVVRFKREAALGSNSVLTHLEAITVKPFSLSEARELLEVPLHFLGLRFPNGKDSEFLIPTILSSANYFPGLIQMYCAKLLQAMRENNYAGYNEVNSPIYEVSAEHIKKVLADTEFTREIREKFEITLGVDEDKYYDAIALIMAYLYHENGYSRGYDANDIKKVSEEFEITKISELSIDKLNAFLEELKDLNIFRNTDATHYLFTRLSFYQMMGSQSEVEDKMFAYMEE